MNLTYLVGDSMPDICTTMDVIFAHSCFVKQVNREHEQFFFFAESLGHQMGIGIDYYVSTHH